MLTDSRGNAPTEDIHMVHCYKLGGYNIVLDIYSGSVHVVDEVAYDVIEAYERLDRDELTKFILEKYNWNDVASATYDLYKRIAKK